jgi:histone acetyltransferase
MIQAQKEFLIKRIRLTSKSDKIVYPPLTKGWKPNIEGTGLSSRGNEAASRALAIPGVLEAGWTMADLLASSASAKDQDRQRTYLKSELLAIIRKIEDQQYAWPFREPVDTNEITDYLTVIKDPIDLSTIEKRIRKGDWYKSKEMLGVDLMRMVNNCKTYNDETSPYHECASSLEKFLKVLFSIS